MMKTTFVSILLTWMAVVRCEPPSNNYGTPLGDPISSYGTPNHHANTDNYDHGEPKAYEFGYQVKDDYSGNNYNRQESSDGNQVRGEYRVALPDGRTQIVTYYADWQSGFHADVRYEGTAQYPEQYNQGGHGGYNNGGQQYGAPSQQYGAPAYNNNNNNNGYSGGYSQAGSATSSVHIKDYSSEATPYNINNNLNSGYNYNNNGNNYDSYNSGSFNKRPTNEYGAP